MNKPPDRNDGKSLSSQNHDLESRERQAAQERFRRLLDQAHDGVFLIKASDETIVDGNETAARMIAAAPEELFRMSISEIIPDRILDRIRRMMAGNVNRNGNGAGLETTLLRKNGTGLPVELTINIASLQDDDYAVIVARDITERLHTRRALRESEQKLEWAIEGANLGLWDWDILSNEITVNDRWAELLGYTYEEVQPKLGTWRDFIHPDDIDGILTSMEQHLDGRMPAFRHEFRMLTKSGEWKWVLNQARVVTRDEHGAPVRVSGTYLDISEVKHLRDLHERAQRLESAGRVAGQVAHDFNNLLGPLMAYPSLMRDEIPQDSTLHAYLDDMEKAAQQIADINLQLLTLGRRGHHVMEAIDLNAVIDTALSNHFHVPPHITVEKHLADDLLKINASNAQLIRVLSNLFANACDAVTDNGKISIRTENFYIDGKYGTIDNIPIGEYVKLTISDNGSGIAPGIIANIFDPFFTTKKADKKRGSGLGLSVVHSVMEDHNGYIDCHSTPEHGTSFYLYFPITRSEAAPSISEEIVGGNENILIVDDDAGQRDVTTRLLTRLGYSVLATDSGEKALALMRGGKPDLLVLDMVMPGGIDGTETLFRAQQLYPGIKAIIVSGYAEGKRVRLAREIGAELFLQKPLTMPSLARGVRTVLDTFVSDSSQSSS